MFLKTLEDLRKKLILKNQTADNAISRRDEKSRFQSTLFLLPSLIGVCVFYVIPFLIVIYYSGIDNPISHKFVGLKNYIHVWNNLAFRKASLNTALFSIVAVPLAVLLAMGLALLLDEKVPGKSKFRTFLLSPMMVPTASVVLIWQVLFHNNGTFNEILDFFGRDSIDWLNSGYAHVVIVLLFLWKNLGYNMILFMAALGSIPTELIEAASLENASKRQIFMYIKLRYMTPTFMFVTLMSIINSFKVFREIYMLKGDYPYSTMYMLQHFMNNTFKSLDYQKMSAAAIIMTIVMIVIIGALFLAEGKLGQDFEDE